MSKGYFSNFPTIQYPYLGKIVDRDDESGYIDTVECADLMLRFQLRDSLYKSPVAFYDWSWRSGDRPDRIAELYYGDSKYAWVVMYSAKLADECFDFPLTENELKEEMLLTYQFIPVSSEAFIDDIMLGDTLVQYVGQDTAFSGRYIGHAIIGSTTVLVVYDTKGTLEHGYDIEAVDSATSYYVEPALTRERKFAALMTCVHHYEDKKGIVIDENEFNSLDPVNRKQVSVYDYEVRHNERNRKIKLLNKSLLPKLLEDFRNMIRSVEAARKNSKIPLILGGRNDKLAGNN